MTLKIYKGEPKETFVLTFPTTIQADYWRIAFINKFAKEFVRLDRFKGKVELTDQIWYFVKDEARIVNGFGHGENITYLPGEAIYIVLDDPERKKLDTYEGV